MDNKNQVDLLLQKWDELRAGDQEITPEELCSDDPHLLAEVKRKIESIKMVERRFRSDESTVDQDTQDFEPSEKQSSDMPVAAGRYRLQHEIARGGMGAVIRAVDPDFDRLPSRLFWLQRARGRISNGGFSKKLALPAACNIPASHRFTRWAICKTAGRFSP